MKVYNYKTEKGDISVQFTSKIYVLAKLRMNVILDHAMQKNPYDEKILSLCLFEFYKQACTTKGEDVVLTESDIVGMLEIDEMLLIYTTLLLERGYKTSQRFKEHGLN